VFTPVAETSEFLAAGALNHILSIIRVDKLLLT
jgi:hypothetical protein